MSSRNRKIAVAVGAAAVASTAALAVGSQMNGQAVAGGSATSAQTRSMDGGRRGGPDVSALATKLGVSTERLERALAATRPKRTGDRDRRGARTAAIAKELNVSTARLERAFRAAFDKARGSGRPPNEAALVSAVADNLKVDDAKVRTALTNARKAHEAEHAARRKEMAAALAKELGISTEKVEAAFASMPRPERGGGPGRPGMGLGGPGHEKSGVEQQSRG